MREEKPFAAEISRPGDEGVLREFGPWESLHNHTPDSDGHQTHLDMLASADKLGAGVIAFTDHDQLPSRTVVEQLKSYSGSVRWLIGIELTSDLTLEMIAEDKHAALHILGLFIDPYNEALLAHCQDLAKSRLKRMSHFVTQLQSLGFKISEEDCLEESGNDFVGNPHIVKALERHPENKVVMDKMMADMKAAGDKDETTKFLYNRMMSEGPRGYPYVLFMKKSSFIPMPQADFGGSLLDLDANVKLIRDAGGVAVLAHWFFDQNKLPVSKLEELLKEKRLDGVETDTVNLITERDLDAEGIFLRQLAGRTDAVQVIGSDAHDEADLAHFAQSDAGKRSVGQTERIIEAMRPDLEWTNIKL